MINELKKYIDRALTQVRPAFRGVVSLLNTASQVSVAQIKGVASEVLNNVPVFQQFGFTSALPDNSTDLLSQIRTPDYANFCCFSKSAGLK
jgi:phage gp45-like